MAEKQKEDQATEKMRKRSPNYPYSSLRDCVELIKRLHKQVGTSKVLIDSAYKYMGLRPTSSSTDRIRAALSSYKLTEEHYENKQRLLNLTDLSHQIAVDVREVSLDRLAAYREAALNDTMTKRVWEERWKNGLPDGATIISILRINYKFQEEAAKRFATVLKDNFAFAQLDEPFDALADYEEAEDQDDSRYNRGTMDNKPLAPPNTLKGFEEYTLTLSKTKEVKLYTSDSLTKDDIDFMMMWIKRLDLERSNLESNQEAGKNEQG